MTMDTPADNELELVSTAVRHRFQSEKRVLSFDEYLAEFFAFPARHSRDAARYVRDCFDYFGSYDVLTPLGRLRRFKLFDQDFAEAGSNEGRQKLLGHEHVQDTFYRALANFAREGRANRLVLLHGPNGSAKSTFAACVMRSLEHYSGTEDGAVYRFSWVFPGGFDDKSIGFGTKSRRNPGGESYAHLEHDKINAKLTSELREHPLLLLPIAERRELIRKAYAGKKLEDNAPDWLWLGRLGHKNAQIFESMLTNYQGDLRKVLAHIQVERYYVSRRYRTAVVTIGPQMSVDASERQITMDRTLASLPGALSSLSLFETHGELVDGAGGVIEFSDLLKRPLESWKYLLLAIESGEISLAFSNLAVNSVFMGSTNEAHLDAFRQHPEYNSFRARLQLCRVGYLLDYKREQQIYETQIIPQVRAHVAPHSTFVAALWSVLTRLLRSDVSHYDEPAVGKLAASLTPMEKALLYADGTIPRRLGSDESKVLRANMSTVFKEFDALPVYEGITGASPREIRTLLLDAAQDPARTCLSPLGVTDQIQALCDKGDYQFLKHKPDAGFHDHRAFLLQVRDAWLTRLDTEVRNSTGLVEESRYEELFDRYIMHVSLWVKGERHRDPLTGKYEEPDETLFRRIEEILEVKDTKEFRRNLISTVAAYAIDHPGARMDPLEIFPRYVERVKESYFTERRSFVAAVIRDMLTMLSTEATTATQSAETTAQQNQLQAQIQALDADRRRDAQSAIDRLLSEWGYCKLCARESLGELLRARYSDA
jgi:predicted Ser/Thr protein kinase